MSLSVLTRRLSDSAKTRATIIKALQTETRYKADRVRRTWTEAELFTMIQEAQRDEKYLNKGDVGRALERFWAKKKGRKFSKLDVYVDFNSRLQKLEASAIRAKKKAMRGVARPAPAPPGSRSGSRGVEPHTVVSTRTLRSVHG